jgi:hypothetical protein
VLPVFFGLQLGAGSDCSVTSAGNCAGDHLVRGDTVACSEDAVHAGLMGGCIGLNVTVGVKAIPSRATNGPFTVIKGLWTRNFSSF